MKQRPLRQTRFFHKLAILSEPIRSYPTHTKRRGRKKTLLYKPTNELVWCVRTSIVRPVGCSDGKLGRENQLPLYPDWSETQSHLSRSSSPLFNTHQTHSCLNIPPHNTPISSPGTCHSIPPSSQPPTQSEQDHMTINKGVDVQSLCRVSSLP